MLDELVAFGKWREAAHSFAHKDTYFAEVCRKMVLISKLKPNILFIQFFFYSSSV